MTQGGGGLGGLDLNEEEFNYDHHDPLAIVTMNEDEYYGARMSEFIKDRTANDALNPDYRISNRDRL